MDVSILQVGKVLAVSFLSEKAIAEAKDKIAFEPYLYKENDVLKINIDGESTDVAFMNWLERNSLTFELKS